MKKNLVMALYLLSAFLGAVCFAEEKAVGEQKVLFVYDEVNDSSKPYIGYFRDAFKASGIAFDESAAAEVKAKNLADYRAIVVHGMVMAFNSKSPVRDWLKTSPDFTGRKVSLFVTANRWYLADLFRDLTGLLKKNHADVIDAVSTATKQLDGAAKAEAVRKQVEKLN